MADDQLQQQQQGENDVQYYIDKLNDYKANTISKADYEKVLSERDTLKKALFEGTGAPEAEKPVRTAEEIRKELFGEEMETMPFTKGAALSLELREAVLREEGVDIFVGSGENFTPDATDYATAQRVADCFTHCLEYADGDDAVFTNELMRLTVDAMPAALAKQNARRR